MFKSIQTVTALEMKRGKTYKVSKHLIPSNICPVDCEEYFIFTVDAALDFDCLASIVTNEGKTFQLPASQAVIEIERA